MEGKITYASILATLHCCFGSPLIILFGFLYSFWKFENSDTCKVHLYFWSTFFLLHSLPYPHPNSVPGSERLSYHKLEVIPLPFHNPFTELPTLHLLRVNSLTDRGTKWFSVWFSVQIKNALLLHSKWKLSLSNICLYSEGFSWEKQEMLQTLQPEDLCSTGYTNDRLSDLEQVTSLWFSFVIPKMML